MENSRGFHPGRVPESGGNVALPPDGSGMSEVKLSDVIDPSVIQRMMDLFFEVTALPFSLIDSKGKILAGVGWQDICTCFHRTHPESCANCIESDTGLTKGIEPGKFNLYKCKNGMWDIATPIMVMGRKLGNIFMGQFFFDDEDVDREFFRAQAERYGFQQEEYMAALDRVPRFSRETIENAMSFFVSLAGYLSEQGLANLRFARSNAENSRLLKEVTTREALQNLAGELASLGWWTVELPEFISIWSDEVARIHEMPPGFTPTVEEGIGFYAPECRERISEVFERCVKLGEPYDEELQIITGTGRRVWVRTMGVPEKDASGNIVRVLGGFQDISELKKAQEDLSRSRERLDLFLNSTSDMAFLKDSSLRHVMANRAYLDFLGMGAGEVIGKSGQDLLPPSLAEQCLKGDLEALRADQQVLSKEFGDGRIFETRKFPVPFRDGSKGVGGLVRDITDLWKTEEALRESEERFRNLFENATIGLYRTSPDGRILMANSSLVKMLGYSSFEELARRDLSKDGFEPDYSREMFQQTMESEGEIVGLESAWTRRDGTVLFVRESARAVRGADGKILHYEGTVEDVTERKAAEDALRKSEAKHRRITENISDVVWTADLDMRTTYISPSIERLLGESVGEHLERNMEDKFPPEDLARIHSIMVEEMEKEKAPDVDRERTRLIEARHYRADGSLIWISMHMSLIRDDNGVPIGIQGVTRDITKRVEAEEKLRKALQTTIEVLTQTVERRDPYTAGHQRRVADLAGAIASEMGFDPERVEGIRVAGYVHDIGKISVPSEILSKPGKLSDIEKNIIREHPQSGRDILRDVDSDIPLAEIIYQHHERLDGSGYPRGLEGEDILIEARILAVADVVEAMASYRPYRPALGIDEALDEIEKNRGTIYDPEVVDVCLRLFREKGYVLAE